MRRGRLIAVGALLLAGLGVFAWVGYGKWKARTKYTPQDERNLKLIESARQSWLPPARDLANGRFRYGDPFSDVTAAYPPELELKSGAYTTALYSIQKSAPDVLHALVIVAKDGKLVSAHSRGRHSGPIFFDGLTKDESREWSEGFDIAYRKHFGLPLSPDQMEYGPIPPPREVGKPGP